MSAGYLHSVAAEKQANYLFLLSLFSLFDDCVLSSDL